MLSDPLAVKSLSLVAHSAITVSETNSFATTDVSPGRTVRLGAVSGYPKVTLTISHSVSNENKPIKTDRALVRFDFGAKGPSNEPVTASAYLVVAVPQGATNSNDDDIDPIGLLQTLLGVLAVSPSAATLSEVNITRILAGEP